VFHLLNYRVVAGINDANVDMAATADSEFSARNNHFIFSEPYLLIGAMHLAVSATRSRFNIPSWNGAFRHTIYPVNRSAVPPSYPRIDDYRNSPMALPMSEEVAVEESNNLGAATEETTVSLWIAPGRVWNPQVPQAQPLYAGGLPFKATMRFTATPTRVAAGWSGGFPITLPETPRGGWYGVVGCYVQSALCRLFRLIFPRTTMAGGRKLRPGGYITNALGNLETPGWQDSLGLWGAFHTFELPQIEVYADAAGADLLEGRLDLIYLSDRDYSSPPL
jgi:hypothetical protein